MLLLLTIFHGFAGAPAADSTWMSQPAVGAAAITAILTVAGIILKDFLLKTVEERRSERRKRIAIYERYSNPLVTSVISLLLRLHEILYTKRRAAYLVGRGIKPGPGPGDGFRAYKKTSTVYRLAAVLGWIRACRREFSFLRVAEPGDTKKVDEAIGAFENALADGSWVEQERVTRLCELWHLSTTEKLTSIASIAELGTRVDNIIWDHMESAVADNVLSLNEPSQQDLCKSIANCIADHLATNHVTDLSMQHTWPDALNIIGMREAWVYRDWQSAIGDLMIQPSPGDARMYEVIGYGDFEQILFAGNEQQKLALARMCEIFDDLDLSIEDRFDSRPRQLRAIAQASAELILAIHKIQGRQSIIGRKAVTVAEDVIRRSTALCKNSPFFR